MNYTRLERQEDSEMYRVVGMVLKNSDEKFGGALKESQKKR